MKNKRVLVPLPQVDFDPTEVSIPWKYLKFHAHEVIFATPTGKRGEADPIMVTGKGLGFLKYFLMADKNGREAYHLLERSSEFQKPISYENIDPQKYDALLLSGGHAKGMKTYLESDLLKDVIAYFFDHQKPVGAICHGTLLAARSKSKITGKSVLWERKTVGLTKLQELLAWSLTCLWMGDYYRTYPTPLEDEVRSSLRSSNDFLRGPLSFRRDSPGNLSLGYVVLDKNYLSARWPGDAHRFATEFVRLIEGIGLS